MSVPKPSISLGLVDAPDPDTATACAMLGVAKESLYRLAKRQLVTGYLLAGKRRWDRESLHAYIARCKAEGPQFSPPVGKRRPGRPRKDQRQPSAASAG